MNIITKIALAAITSLSLAATTFASEILLIVPNGQDAVAYHDKTYTFAATDQDGIFMTIGAVYEDQNGATIFSSTNLPEYFLNNAPFKVSVMVTSGAPAFLASNDANYICAGNYTSTNQYGSLDMISFSAEDGQWITPASCQ